MSFHFPPSCCCNSAVVVSLKAAREEIKMSDSSINSPSIVMNEKSFELILKTLD